MGKNSGPIFRLWTKVHLICGSDRSFTRNATSFSAWW